MARAENEVRKAFPHSEECGLLYALRVSRCVPDLKSLKTLASRWLVAGSLKAG